MKIATVGLDLAKTLAQVHGVDSQGHIVVRKHLRRADVLPFFAKLEPCVVGMEAWRHVDHRIIGAGNSRSSDTPCV
jgi:transposase